MKVAPNFRGYIDAGGVSSEAYDYNSKNAVAKVVYTASLMSTIYVP